DSRNNNKRKPKTLPIKLKNVVSVLIIFIIDLPQIREIFYWLRLCRNTPFFLSKYPSLFSYFLITFILSKSIIMKSKKAYKIIFWSATIFIFLFEGVMPALTSHTELAK